MPIHTVIWQNLLCVKESETQNKMHVDLSVFRTNVRKWQQLLLFQHFSLFFNGGRELGWQNSACHDVRNIACAGHVW